MFVRLTPGAACIVSATALNCAYAQHYPTKVTPDRCLPQVQNLLLRTQRSKSGQSTMGTSTHAQLDDRLPVTDPLLEIC
jgi:hypothetical protein